MAEERITRAVVMGGGGVAGIAWETGLLAGLLDAGVDVSDADTVVGTSAGSVVGGLMRGGRIGQSYAGVVSAGAADAVHGPAPDMERFMAAMAEVLAQPGDEQHARAAVGGLARRLDPADQPGRVAVFQGLLGGSEWPRGRLLITAVDAEDGAFRVFQRDDGEPLATVVAASCAVPLVYPTVRIGGRDYMDGGMRSATNADLVQGADRVLVLACDPEPPVSPLGPQLPQTIEALRASAHVLLVEPDEASRLAFGTNPLARSVTLPCALAGHAQAASVARRVRDLWS